MKKYLYVILLIVIGVLLINLCVACNSKQSVPVIDLGEVNSARLPYGFHEKYFCSGTQLLECFDLDLDGTSEIIGKTTSDSLSNVRNQVLLNDSTLKNMDVKSFAGEVAITPNQFDIDGDGYKEIVIFELKQDTLFLHIWNYHRGELTTSVLAFNHHLSTRKWDCSASLFQARDMTGDGIKELFISVVTNFGYHPRFIGVWDMVENEYFWRFDMGAAVTHAYITDYDHDGIDEVVCSTRSPDNGEDTLGESYVINNTDDRRCYFITLDIKTGQVEKLIPFGSKMGNMAIQLFDWKGDGQIDVLALYRGRDKGEDRCFIAPWNSQVDSFSPMLKKKLPKAEYLSVFGDRKSCIVAYGNGQLELLDENLQVKYAVRFPGVVNFGVKYQNILGDPENEIIINGIHRDESVLIILDQHFKLLGFVNDLKCTACYQEKASEEYANIIGRLKKCNIQLIPVKQPLHFLPFAGAWKEFGMGIFFTILIVTIILLVLRPRYRLHDMKKIFNILYHKEATGYFFIDNTGRIKIANKLFLEWLLLHRDQVENQHYEEILHDDEFYWLSEKLYVFINEDTHYMTFEYQSQNSRYYVVKMVKLPFPVIFSRVRIILLQDVTDFVQSKRAVAWASMAQKLAHEIKTPLSTVLLSAQQIESKIPSNKYTNNIKEQVQRLQIIIDDMLKFAHVEPPRLEPVDLNELVKDVLEVLKLQIGSAVKVNIHLADDQPELKGDSHQLSMAMQNCISNSLTAMQGKGILTVSTKYFGQSQNNKQSGKMFWSEIEITDSGKGMSKEELDMLFQPFFTLSPKGTGLGMVIVWKIVNDHRGSIKVDSEVGKGTTNCKDLITL